MVRLRALEAQVAVLRAAQDERRAVEIAPIDGRVRAAVRILEGGQGLVALGEQPLHVHVAHLLRRRGTERNCQHSRPGTPCAAARAQ